MATPRSNPSYGVDDPDWVATSFANQPSHPAGSIFAYDTAATVVLGSIVEKLRGTPFLETMRAPLLDVIGFSPQAWCVRTPERSSWGGIVAATPVASTVRDCSAHATAELPPDAAVVFQRRLASLQGLPQRDAGTTQTADLVNNRTYRLQPNPMGIEWLRFRFGVDSGTLTYRNRSGGKSLEFGTGRVVETIFPETHYFGEQIGVAADRAYRCLASVALVEDQNSNLQVYITDIYFGTLSAIFSFAGNETAVFMTKTAEWFLYEYQGFAGGTCS